MPEGHWWVALGFGLNSDPYRMVAGLAFHHNKPLGRPGFWQGSRRSHLGVRNEAIPKIQPRR